MPTSERDEPPPDPFVFPKGGRNGLLLALVLDKLWKIVQLKIDDILLHQKDMVRDEVRLKMTEVLYDKKEFEKQIANLHKKIKLQNDRLALYKDI